MIIKIKGKKCEARFGASALVRLGRVLGKDTLDDTINEISKLDFDNLTLDSIEILSHIVIAGLNNADGNRHGIKQADVQDMLFNEKEQGEVTKALEGFIESISVHAQDDDKPSKKK